MCACSHRRGRSKKKKQKKEKSKSLQNLFISLLKTRIRILNKMANRNKPDQSNELSSTKEEKLKIGNRPKYQLKISIPLDKLSGYIPRNPTTSNRDENNRN